MRQIHAPVKQTMKLRELPSQLRDAFDVPPDTEVHVTVELAGATGRDRLLAVMAEIGAQCEANGLTEEILEEILNER